MKKLLIAVIAVLVLVLLGWLKFSGGDGMNPSVEFDSAKASGDLEQVGEKAKELGSEATRAIKDVDVDVDVDGDGMDEIGESPSEAGDAPAIDDPEPVAAE